MPEINQLDIPDSQLIAGDFRNPILLGERQDDTAAFCAVVDRANLNDRYPGVISGVDTYLASRGLASNPIRIVTQSTFGQAYAAAGESHAGGAEVEEGRNIHGRSVVVVNEDAQKVFGDDYLLAVSLHEVAHDLKSDLDDSRDVAGLSNESNVTQHMEIGEIATRGTVSSGQNREALDKQEGVFWDEGFSDLVRVRGLRYLGKGHTISGEPKTVDMNGVAVKLLPLEFDTGANSVENSAVIPAEFASAAIPATLSVNGENLTAVSPANLAAYAYELLDERLPGLYEDREFASYYPNRLNEVIRKIDSIRPGLYRELCELEYTGRDFSRGLQIVLDSLNPDAK